MKLLSLFALSALFAACTQSTSDDRSIGVFAIRLLQDTTMTAGDAHAQSLNSLVLSPTAFLTAEDMSSYVWSTHAFTLTSEAEYDFSKFAYARGSTRGVPFVVTVGNDRIYLGTFWWAYSSSMPPPCAVIEVISSLPRGIELATGAVDKRNDPRIRMALKMAGVLRE